MITDKAQMEALLTSDKFGLKPGSFEITPDGLVNVLKDGVSIWGDACQDGKIMVRFGTVNGFFACSDCGLTTMEGFPTSVSSNLRIPRNSGLTSWDHAPKVVGGGIDASFCGFTDLVGMPSANQGNVDIITKIRLHGNLGLRSLTGIETSRAEVVVVPFLPDLPMLRLLALRESISIRIVAPGATRDDDYDDNSRAVTKILRDHWEMYHRVSKNRAIMAAQKALVSAGYGGNARW